MKNCAQVGLLLFIMVIGFPSRGQQVKQERRNSKNPIICYAGEERHTNIPPPEAFQKFRGNAVGRTKTANFEVTYVGFTPEAQAAFQFAVDIWETQISSTVPIKVTAVWQSLKEGVLGSAGTGTYYADFQGAQQLNTWYPVALAEKMAGVRLNSDQDADIVANFSSSANWYLNTSGTPAAGQYDLVTVVLHELGHGLGIIDSYNVANDGAAADGTVGFQNRPIIYDRFIENNSGQSLYLDIATPSPSLKTELTSGSIFFDSPGVLSANGNQRGKIYAPSAFNSGSSISHLDEFTYNGTNNALMTPQIGATEIIHNPGPITMGMLGDMGWVYTRIDHIPLKSSENLNGPYVVNATITSEAGAVTTPKIFYSNGGADIELAMTPTANPNEYTASIPGTGSATAYGYYIQTNDATGRTFTNPGVRQNPGEAIQQFYNTFSTGPDTQAPRITHSPKGFVLNTDTEFLVEAIVSDNIGIGSATLEYLINDVGQAPLAMQQGTPDSLYSATITLVGLTVGDVIKYRITAVDNSSNQNQKIAPETDYFIVNVVGLMPTQDSYQNNFDVPTTDFFGDGFTITMPAGFTSPAIHSTHPYGEGNGFPGNQQNLSYQLTIPVRVQAQDATIKFDEVVLIEPGDDDPPTFGDENFFDYVVVEGSIDGGVTWIPVGPGYDSRADAAWLVKYNSAIDGNNSTAVGDPTLFRERVFNLLNVFNENDEVVIRFRLFSDPFAAGWGWAIDNLRIQIDDTPPRVLNDHVDYIVEGEETLTLQAKATDVSGLANFWIEYQINDDPIILDEYILLPDQEDFSFNLNGVNNLVVGDVIKYRFSATDMAGNTGSFPPTGFIEVPKIQFASPVSTYSNNFNTATADFVGNFFSISQPTGFSDGLIQSTSPYLTGLGLDQTSEFAFLLKKPITINGANPYIRFDEVAIVENHPAGAAFGDAAFKDFVIVEGSKDGGATWLPFLDGYDAGAVSSWNTAYLNKTNATPALFKQRIVNMIENGNFSAGENVIVRFKLFSDAEKNAYGWVIDNLYIQDPITGLENESPIRSVTVYPNPVTEDNTFVLRIESSGVKQVEWQILSAQGIPLQHQQIMILDSIQEQVLTTSNLPNGVYLIKVVHKYGSTIKKFIIAR